MIKMFVLLVAMKTKPTIGQCTTNCASFLIFLKTCLKIHWIYFFFQFYIILFYIVPTSDFVDSSSARTICITLFLGQHPGSGSVAQCTSLVCTTFLLITTLMEKNVISLSNRPFSDYWSTAPFAAKLINFGKVLVELT